MLSSSDVLIEVAAIGEARVAHRARKRARTEVHSPGVLSEVVALAEGRFALVAFEGPVLLVDGAFVLLEAATILKGRLAACLRARKRPPLRLVHLNHVPVPVLLEHERRCAIWLRARVWPHCLLHFNREYAPVATHQALSCCIRSCTLRPGNW